MRPIWIFFPTLAVFVATLYGQAYFGYPENSVDLPSIRLAFNREKLVDLARR